MLTITPRVAPRQRCVAVADVDYNVNKVDAEHILRQNTTAVPVEPACFPVRTRGRSRETRHFPSTGRPGRTAIRNGSCKRTLLVLQSVMSL